ncbi:MAG: hypothetical protein SGCHY_000080 [Lobulomycetales sp.]
MRLLTHNFLQCSRKQCAGNNFPLRISEAQLRNCPADFSPALLLKLLPRLHWPAVVQGARALGLSDALPETLDTSALPLSPDDAAPDLMALLKELHRILMDTTLQQAALTCPGCSRIFPVIDSIPNMLLTEDEV